jgi:ribosomal protein L2
VSATVLRIEHAPDRSARVALVQYEDGVLSYILAPLLLRPGDVVLASENAPIAPGNCLPFRKIPIGSIVHNVEIRPGAGGQMIRAAGTYATILNKDEQYATLKLASTEIRKFQLDCWATIGQLSNQYRWYRVLGFSRRSLWLGRRPEVRGNAMQPSEHPHGGGTSSKHTKMPPRTKWGIPAWGFKTRDRKKPLGLIVTRRLGFRLQKKYGLRKKYGG